MKPFRQTTLGRLLHKEVILIDCRIGKDGKADESLSFARVSESQAFALGYLKAVRFKDEWRYIFFKTFVRFYAPPGFETIEPSDKETSATLYEYYRSRSEEKFIDGVTTRKSMDPSALKKLAIIAVIGAVAAVGVLLVLMK